MEIVSEQAETYTEALRRLKEKFGGRFVEMQHQKIRLRGLLGFFGKEGVEVKGYIRDYMPGFAASPQAPYAQSPGIPQAKVGSLAEEKEKFIAASKKDPTLQVLLSEVKDIKKQLEKKNDSQASPSHSTIERLTDALALNDFSHAYIRHITGRVKKEITLEALDNYEDVEEQVVDWIGESIRIHDEEAFHLKPRILVLVGPTGVGKTTTIAKLAAMYNIGGSAVRPLSVRLINIDNYRIGAKQQLETYSSIMDIPLSNITDHEELRKTIALYAGDADLILVDTIGKSPQDGVELAKMKQLLSACGSRSEVHLALSATTKASDIGDLLRQFEPFGYGSVIVTKLDETSRVGNVLSALWEKDKAVSYITNGQTVPVDIRKASVVPFLINLEGFRINRERIENRFPGADAEKINWRQ
ncbi:MAG: flagellar biosynthesis protein FlhF [Spirochaetaceae bacterium]|jgi:flagellar biosynthesis protein FlhF|nr:flagellar biosynthesis protein FlhF [Spirochaetaceae bacterium]